MTAITATTTPRSRRMTLRRRRQFAGFLFALPAIGLVIGFIGVPIGQAVYYSFTSWDGLTATWIGPSTWSQAFHNPNLWTALGNNAKLLLAVPFALGLPLCTEAQRAEEGATAKKRLGRIRTAISPTWPLPRAQSRG